MSLFDQQDAAESDFLKGPGFTAEDVRPSTFAGFTPATIPSAIGAGVGEGVGMLVGGIPGMLHTAITGAALDATHDTEEAGAVAGEIEKPWMAKLQKSAEAVDMELRSEAKALMPDPKVSGTGTNLIFGFAKTGTEAVGALALRKPALAAPLFGYLQGLGSYRDLRDEGVDDKTAQHVATMTGVLSGASFFAPAGLPTRWLSEMEPAAQAVTQLATGTSVNTAVGMGSRYLTSKLLENAGYLELAAQNRVLDGQAMLADMLSGAFFGGAHFFNGHAQALADQAREAAESGILDPSIRDAAKVAQDARMAAIDRAPGIAVDGDSAHAHSQALEKALGDLLQDKPVDVGNLMDGATFVRHPHDEVMDQNTREMMHQEFIDAGVMGEASKVDSLDRTLESYFAQKGAPPYEGDVRIPQEDGSIVKGEEATAKAKEEAANDEGPALLKAAAECAGRTG